ncbi:MAG: RelA/SpoT domain-containing protein [Candidatus Parabeggiatoa sp.]|nr:RelA/SpoT domain-containing protein [Candidatus Parabeggiatoa sp.]
MTNEIGIQEILKYYEEKHFELEQFLVGVQTFFNRHPVLNSEPVPIIHSVKSRFKDPEHLRDKIQRKFKNGHQISKDSLFEKINDLIGVRVLHLYQDQFPTIHNEISKKIENGDWCFVENPKAYTWDPESKKQYDDLKIDTEIKDSFYTSVHYVIRPNNSSNPVCCEIQVRTLFEEIWGEIDHTINYPHPTPDIACKEQLRVLSKLVSTGTRLADSIFRTYTHYKEKGEGSN